MARRLLLFSTICSIFLLGYFLPRWTGPDNCINSSLVEEITVLPERQKLNSCDLREASFSNPPPHRLQSLKILDRIEALEFLTEYWGKPSFKIALVVEKDSKPKLHFREDHLIISEGMLYKEGVLEKAIMQYWLGSSDFMTAEVITNTIWNIYKDNRDFKARSWLQDFSSLSRYCQRGLNILQHSEYCQIQNELYSSVVEAEPDNSPIIWSLSSAVSQVLTETFYRLSLSDKRKFLTNLVFLNNFEDTDGVLTSSGEFEDFADLDSRFEALINYAVVPLDIRLSNFRPSIIARTSQNRTYDFVIVNSDVNADFRSVYFEDKTDIVLEEDGLKNLYPGNASLELSREQVFNDLNVRSLTIVGCEIPRPRRLLEFDGLIEQVLYVRVCDDSGQIQEIIETGAKDYVRKDANIEFIEFNIAALKVATQKRGELQSSTDLNSWKKWLQWSDFIYENDMKAYRPQAVYEGVGLFRAELN